MPHPKQPIWMQSDAGLELRVGHHPHPLPEALRDWLTGADITGDAAADLIILEGSLRQSAFNLLSTVDATKQNVTAAATILNDISKPWWSLSKRRERRDASDALAAAVDEYLAATQGLTRVRALIDVVREFVINADVSTGLLAEAARGWRRSAHQPITVNSFDSEEGFLAADLRRATTAELGRPTVAGEEFGRTWRRDGDDDPRDDPLQRSGPWTLGYIPRTAEIYAIRRCTYLPEEVWVLGSSEYVATPVRDLLQGLQPRMCEPNSLLLAAESVYTASCAPAPPPKPTGPADEGGGMGTEPEIPSPQRR